MIGKIGKNKKYFIRNILTGFLCHLASHHSHMAFYPLIITNQKMKPVLLSLFYMGFGWQGIFLVVFLKF